MRGRWNSIMQLKFNDKVRTAIHWTSTILLCLILAIFIAFYIFRNESAGLVFESLGFPAWLVFPLAIAKIAAIILLLSKFERALTEWVYSGLFFNLLLAFGAHAGNRDGQGTPALVAIILLVISYFTWEKSRGKSKINKE